MNYKTIIAKGMLLVTTYCQGSGFSYSEAEQHWQENKETSAYRTYASEFIKYSQAHRMDTNLGCYDLGSEPVKQYLIIKLGNSRKFALVEDVVSKVDTPKSRCFIDSYKGVQVKTPPYLPFILQMEFR